VVLYLGVAAFFVLRVACLLCLTTYAAVTALLILSGLAMSLPMTTLHRRVFGDLRAVGSRPAVLLVVVLFLAGAASTVAFFPSEAALRAGAGQRAAPAVSPELKAEFERWWDAQPRVPLPVSADGARVVVLKFSDLQCPSCSISYFAMKPILERFQDQYPGAVKMVTKDYPLQPDCNSSVQRPIHLAACDAAAAVRMARQQGKGDALEEWFYANQAAISPSSVRQAAASVGAVLDFDKGLASAMSAVKTDVGLGQFLSVRSTPTYFINGVRCEAQGQPLAPQFLDIAIARELQKAGAAK
jgi:protein-disulfide isomerase